MWVATRRVLPVILASLSAGIFAAEAVAQGPVLEPPARNSAAPNPAEQPEFIDYTDPEVQKRTGLRPVTAGPTCNPPRPRGLGPDVRAARIRLCLYSNGTKGPPPTPPGWFWREQALDIYNCPPGSNPQRYRVITGERYTREPCGKLAWNLTKEYAETFGETWPRNFGEGPPEKAGETPENVTLEVAQSGEQRLIRSGQFATGRQPRPLEPGPLMLSVSVDGQAYCTYGTAEPTLIAFVPADEMGEPLSPDSLAMAGADTNMVPAMSPVGPRLPVEPLPPIAIGDTPTGGQPPGLGGEGGRPNKETGPGKQVPPPEDRKKSGDPPSPQPALQTRGDGDDQHLSSGTETDRVQVGDDADNELIGTRGPDHMAGSKGNDTYKFGWNPLNPLRDDPESTLNNGDRIADYEFGEEIKIEHVRFDPRDVRVTYDQEKDQTSVEIKPKNPNSNPGGYSRTLILDGDKRGEVDVETECCVTFETTITITSPEIRSPESVGPAPEPTPQQRAQPGGEGTEDAAFPEQDMESAADSGPPALEPPVFEIGDTGNGRRHPPSAMDDPDNPHVQTGDDGGNELNGTRGADDIVGGKGKDTFRFDVDPMAGRPGYEDRTSTLNEGDRIRDYESGEAIELEGVDLRAPNVKVVYDGDNDETRVEIDLSDLMTGAPDGKPDKVILLDGDKRGRLRFEGECCGGRRTRIFIDVPQEGAPRTAEPELVPDAAPQQSADPSGAAVPQGPQEDSAPGDLAAPEEPVSTEPVATITVFVKATEAVLEGDPSGAALKSELVKLVPLVEPDLPKFAAEDPPPASAEQPAELAPEQPSERAAQASPEPPEESAAFAAMEPRDDSGFDKDPVTCTTGEDGQCMAEIAPEEREIYGFPAGGPVYYRVDLSLGQNTGGIVEQTGTPMPLPKPPRGVSVIPSHFAIGERRFTRIHVQAPEEVAEALMERYAEVFGPAFKIDICIIKKPGPPLGMRPASFSAVGRALPQAELRLAP